MGTEPAICRCCFEDIPLSADNVTLLCPKCGTENRPAAVPPVIPTPSRPANLYPCPECGHSISKRAETCPSCGAKVPKQTSKAAVVLTILFGALIIAVVISANISGRKSQGNQKAVTARIRASDNSLVVENKSSEDWPVLTLYLNGSPPFTYNVSIAPLRPGGIITIPLSKFTKRNGQRFDASAYRVTEVWIGGGDFDYAKYSFGN